MNTFKALMCFLVIISTSAPAYAQNNTFSHTLNFESSSSEYNWVTTSWGVCDIPCGGDQVSTPLYRGGPPQPPAPRIQYRTVECQDSLGNVISSVPVPPSTTPPDETAEFCGYQTRPALQRDCPNENICSWRVTCRRSTCWICIIIFLLLLAACASGMIAACIAAG